MIGSNTIEFRKVRRRQPEPEGVTWIETWQVRTRDVAISLGALSLSVWSAWRDIDMDGFIYVDENGAPL